MRREITIDLPKNWYEDNNFLGFALFYHRVPLDHDDDYIIRSLDNLKFHLSISHGDQFEYMHNIWFTPNCKVCFTNGYSSWSYGCDKDCTSCRDPALMVAYFPQIAISSKYRSNRWNNFKASFEDPFECGAKAAFQVESCGIHLIYNYAQISSSTKPSTIQCQKKS